MNKIFLVGSLVKDCELKESPQGKSYVRNALAVWKPSKDKDTNAADFFNLVAFDKIAGFMAKYCKKGSRLIVIGRVQTSTYEKNGEQRTAFEVVVEECTFAGGKGKQD